MNQKFNLSRKSVIVNKAQAVAKNGNQIKWKI